MLTLLAQIRNPVLPAGMGGVAGDDGGVALAVTMGNLYQTVVVVGGLALFLYMAWGGINWILASGDKGKIEDAKNKLTNAVIGMGILVAVIAIVNLLTAVFGFDILNPTIPEPVEITETTPQTETP
jgi:hypothetical protein